MDRISGLMPQIGWSPLLSALPPKSAPATTVEPSANAANTNSGLGAEADGKAQAERIVRLQARNRDVTVETAVLAQSRSAATPDPDAPTGPPPTFDVTPLEAQAAAQRAVPKPVPETEPQAEASTEAPAAESSSADVPEAAPEVETEAAKPAVPAEVPAAPQPAPQTEHVAAAPSGDWQATAEAAEPSLDVTR